MSFKNTPWKAEATQGEFLVVDNKGYVVVSIPADIEDLEPLGFSVETEREKAYLFAASPLIYKTAKVFFEALCDETKNYNQELLTKLAEDMGCAIANATPPIGP